MSPMLPDLTSEIFLKAIILNHRVIVTLHQSLCKAELATNPASRRCPPNHVTADWAMLMLTMTYTRGQTRMHSVSLRRLPVVF